MEDRLPFRFNRIGGFWSKKGDVEIDIVAINDDEGYILFGECKLKGGRFTKAEAQRLKEKAEYVVWRIGKRKESFAMFSMDEIMKAQRKALEREGILYFDLRGLLVKTGRRI